MTKTFYIEAERVIGYIIANNKVEIKNEDILKMSPTNGTAIIRFLVDKDVVTELLNSLVIKPNGSIHQLYDEIKSNLQTKTKEENDHRFNRFKDWISIIISVLALIISVVSMYYSCFK